MPRRASVAAALAVLVTLSATSSAGAAEPAGVSDLPVTFQVRNTNTSRSSCPADGGSYTVRGHLIAPTAQLAGGANRTVTLYLHGLGFGEFFWHFTALPGYDFATTLAQAGDASVVIDRLGYGTSDKPPGAQSCYGSQADVSHQIIGQLRAGSFATADGTPAPAFGKIVLASHSASGFTAQDEAYSYGDINGLMLFSFADAGATPMTLGLFGQTQAVCATGGQRQAGSSGPGGYAYVGQTDAEFQAAVFFDTDPAVQRAVTALRSRDPCGETASAVSTGAADTANDAQVKVPVLLASGDHDAEFSPQSLALQKMMFSASPDVTAVTLPGTGHAVTLGRSAGAFSRVVIDWLSGHGFAGSPAAAAPSTGARPGSPASAPRPPAKHRPSRRSRKHCVNRVRHRNSRRHCHTRKRSQHHRVHRERGEDE